MEERLKLWRVVAPCANQDTGKRLAPGDVVELSAFEYGRLLSIGAIVPHVGEREKAVAQQAENRVIEYVRRKRGRKAKKA